MPKTLRAADFVSGPRVVPERGRSAGGEGSYPISYFTFVYSSLHSFLSLGSYTHDFPSLLLFLLPSSIIYLVIFQLSIHMSVCLFTHLSIHPFLFIHHLFIHSRIHLLIHTSIYPSVHLSIHQSIHLSICLPTHSSSFTHYSSTCPYIYLSLHQLIYIYPLVNLSHHPTTHLSICSSVYSSPPFIHPSIHLLIHSDLYPT